jgi:hypothetical protein
MDSFLQLKDIKLYTEYIIYYILFYVVYLYIGIYIIYV